MAEPPRPVLIDGAPLAGWAAAVSVFDWGLQRGDGCFEAIRSYGGRPFRMGEHLDRLGRSGAAIDLALPARGELERWIGQTAAEMGDGIIRVVATRGSDLPTLTSPPRVIVIGEPLPDVPLHLRLALIPAPWHPGGAAWELAGAKTLSYAPNLAAGRLARRAGFDDALLISREGLVLEGPTFAVGWVVGASLELPSLDLGVLGSISRAVVVEEARRLGVRVTEGHFPVGRLREAQEVLAMSTVKEVVPVTAVGEQSIAPGAVTHRLAEAFAARVAAEIG